MEFSGDISQALDILDAECGWVKGWGRVLIEHEHWAGDMAETARTLGPEKCESMGVRKRGGRDCRDRVVLGMGTRSGSTGGR